ncbi:MAG: hypothetical protein U1E05_17325 [Patescibacteria group bacterium]|nr:hypothetical protein [Patescibacteria group bacterium]
MDSEDIVPLNPYAAPQADSGQITLGVLPVGLSLAALLPTMCAVIVEGVSSAVQFVPGMLAVAWIVWAFRIKPWRQVAAMLKNTPEYHAAGAFLLSEDQLRTETRYCRIVFRWEHFDAFRDLGDVLLLHSPRKSPAQVVPASFFAEADWQRLLQLVARKLPAR